MEKIDLNIIESFPNEQDRFQNNYIKNKDFILSNPLKIEIINFTTKNSFII